MLKVAWKETYCHGLPEGHRFPMEKYNVLPQQLLYEGTLTAENFFSPIPAADRFIASVHDGEYIHKLKTLSLSRKEERITGFPLSKALIDREYDITGGTIQAVLYAMTYGIAGNIAGGTHHAFRDRGEGFCLYNDIAVGSLYAIQELGLKKILVVDLDVHQGNGTAAIFLNDDRVFTFSMHGAKNYPLHKQPSDLDIGWPDGTGDKAYLNKLEAILPRLIDMHEPEFIFYQSGVDVLESDKLGRLSLSIQGCKSRDSIVFGLAFKNKIPVVFNMGGGYSERIATIVEAHANTFRIAQEYYF